MEQELLLEIKKYIEDTEVTIDGEWGSCRNLNGLLEDKAMPPLYNKILELIKS